MNCKLSRKTRRPAVASMAEVIPGIDRCMVPGKKTPGARGEPGHTRDTHGTRGRTRAHGTHRQTSQPSKPNDTPARPRDGRNRGRLCGSTSAGQARNRPLLFRHPVETSELVCCSRGAARLGSAVIPSATSSRSMRDNSKVSSVCCSVDVFRTQERVNSPNYQLSFSRSKLRRAQYY